MFTRILALAVIVLLGASGARAGVMAESQGLTAVYQLNPYSDFDYADGDTESYSFGEMGNCDFADFTLKGAGSQLVATPPTSAVCTSCSDIIQARLILDNSVLPSSPVMDGLLKPG